MHARSSEAVHEQRAARCGACCGDGRSSHHHAPPAAKAKPTARHALTPSHRMAPSRRWRGGARAAPSLAYRATTASVVRASPDVLPPEWRKYLHQRQRWAALLRDGRGREYALSACGLHDDGGDTNARERRPPPRMPPTLPSARCASLSSVASMAGLATCTHASASAPVLPAALGCAGTTLPRARRPPSSNTPLPARTATRTVQRQQQHVPGRHSTPSFALWRVSDSNPVAWR